jgi:hypothetical protein
MIVREWITMADTLQNGANSDAMKDAVISMAVESWRVSRVLERLLAKLDISEQNRYKSQFNWFIKKVEGALESVDMRIVNVEGQSFDAGMAATPVNIEDFETDDSLFVDQMLEPIIMESEHLLKSGTVTLRRIER